MEVEVLSRIQFAMSITFHIIFPTLNLGLALFLVYVEAKYLKTKNKHYLSIAKYWTKIFALTFGMGVVSGIVMSYQLGTNFAGFSKAVGPVLGPLFAYEVLTAFFLEAGFLGIMLFGWDKVTPRMHFLATVAVWFGTTLSAFWIMSANSWMQAPTGFHIADGVFNVSSWSQVIFNPTFLIRYLHMITAAFISTAFVLMSISAIQIIKKIHPRKAITAFRTGLIAAAIISPIQVFIGDTVGLNVIKYQPIKTAAIEALWETQKGAPLVLFALPNMAQEQNEFSLELPKLASLINTHSVDGKMQGLKSVPKNERPNVPMVFWSFRIMVGLGLWFITLSWLGIFYYFKNKLFSSKKILWLFVYSGPLGFIATIAGWYVAEIGRQPYVVYGLLKTADTVSAVTAEQVILSIGLFLLAYLISFSAYIYYVKRLINTGPTKEPGEIVLPGYASKPILFNDSKNNMGDGHE